MNKPLHLLTDAEFAQAARQHVANVKANPRTEEDLELAELLEIRLSRYEQQARPSRYLDIGRLAALLGRRR